MGCTSIQPESFYSLGEEVALWGGVGIGERGTELGWGGNWGERQGGWRVNVSAIYIVL